MSYGGDCMAPRQCKRCKTLFNYMQGDVLCPRCKEKEEEEFKTVRKYLKLNPKSTIHQTVNDTGIPIKTVTKFIRDGRLEITDDSPIGIDCQRCGRMIKTGSYCEECEVELRKELNQVVNKTKTIKDESRLNNKSKSKLYYFHK